MIKRNISNIMAIAFLAILLMPSCTKMNDNVDDFLGEGSILYAPKVDTAMAYPGKERIEIQVKIKTARVDYVEVWYDTEHYDTIKVGNRAGQFSRVLELPESAYVFNLISVDQWGNKSLAYELSCDIYGTNFRKTCSNRAVSGMAFNAREGAVVKLASPSKYCVTSFISYTNTSDQKVVREVANEETSVSLSDWKSGIQYYSAFRPNENAIDTFMTKIETFSVPSPLPIDKSTWSIVGKDSEVNGSTDNYALNAINGRYNDRWHTGSNPWPHWMIVDMGGPVPIKRFGVMPSSFDEADGIDDRFPKEVRWEVSDDGTNWTTLSESATTKPAQGVEQFFDVTPTTARYFRFTGVIGTYDGDPNNNYMVISELDVEL